MNNKFIDGFDKTAGILSLLGKHTGVSDFRAGRKAMSEAEPKARQAVQETKDLVRAILNRKREVKNRISAMQGKKFKYNFLPDSTAGSTPKEVKEHLANLSIRNIRDDMVNLKKHLQDTKQYWQPSINSLSDAKALKDKGISKMWATGGTGASLGLGAAYLGLKKKKAKNQQEYDNAIS